MSEEVENEGSPLQGFTAMDLQVFLQSVVSVIVLGGCEIRIHPCRFPIIVNAMIRYGAADTTAIASGAADGIDYDQLHLPIEVPGPEGPVTGYLMQWGHCGEDGCVECDKLSKNPYASPEKQSSIWTP